MGEIEQKTIIIEENDLYTRVRTQCDDQNYIREYYMNKVSLARAIAACAYLLDINMDMNLLMLETLKEQINLTPEQTANFDKLKLYHSNLTTLTLQSNNWEIDWVYGEVKEEQNILGYQFFQKRAELKIGNQLPI